MEKEQSGNSRSGARLRTALTALLAGTVAYAHANSVALIDETKAGDEHTSARPLRVNKQLPLRFEENRGQVDAAVRYVSKQAGSAVFLTRDGAVMSFASADSPAHTVRMTFGNSDGASVIAGEGPLETRTNYFVGKDPGRWHAGVPSFSRVRYRDVYAGIDVVYHGAGHRLEYDFIVAPGAKPEVIALAFDGAERTDIDRDGNLVLRTEAGELRHRRPFAYQTIDGRRRAVAARYVRRGDAIGIALARYDRLRPLIIDPIVVLYSTYLGGAGADKVLGVAADASGNTYVAGLTQSVDFPTLNPIQSAKSGSTDVFIAKINAAGNALVYSTFLGGSNVDAALGIARDAAGNAYVTGYTASPDFPATPNVVQPALKGGAYDAFVAKLGPGGALVYSTFLGGSNVDVANAITVDASGSAWVAGFTCSPDFPVVNAYQPNLSGLPNGCFAAKDAFVAEIAPDASAWTYSTYFGGGAKDEANAIALDGQGRVSIAGVTASDDLPIAGPPLMGHRGSDDAFVARFAAGTLDYATYYGGTGDDAALGLATDNAGALHMTGSTQSPDLPTVNALQTDLHGAGDAFVAKLVAASGPNGNASLVYATYLGGSDEDTGRAIALDGGIAHVTGETHSIDFPLHAATQSLLDGSADAFVGRIGPSGALLFSTFLGGDDEDAGWGIALSPGLLRSHSMVHVGGVTYSSDLSTTGALQPDLHGASDGFVVKLGYSP